MIGDEQKPAFSAQKNLHGCPKCVLSFMSLLPLLKCTTGHLSVLTSTAQGGGGVTDPGGIQGTFGRCVEGRGLVRAVGDGWMVGLGGPVGLFQPW